MRASWQRSERLPLDRHQAAAFDLAVDRYAHFLGLQVEETRVLDG